MKIYIAAGLSAAKHVEELGEKIERIGRHSVINSWQLTWEKQQEGPSGAYQDLAEIDRADCCIFLTYSKSSSGGRYIEQGYALAAKHSGEGVRLIICGPKENCFGEMDDFEHFINEKEMLNAFEQERSEEKV